MIPFAVMIYVRFHRSLRNVDVLLPGLDLDLLLDGIYGIQAR